MASAPAPEPLVRPLRVSGGSTEPFVSVGRWHTSCRSSRSCSRSARSGGCMPAEAVCSSKPLTDAFHERVRLRLPLVLFNTGATALVVTDLRIEVDGDPNRTGFDWITTLSARAPRTIIATRQRSRSGGGRPASSSPSLATTQAGHRRQGASIGCTCWRWSRRRRIGRTSAGSTGGHRRRGRRRARISLTAMCRPTTQRCKSLPNGRQGSLTDVVRGGGRSRRPRRWDSRERDEDVPLAPEAGLVVGPLVGWLAFRRRAR